MVGRMASKDDCIQKYIEYKHKYHATPKHKDFLKFAGISDKQLTKLYGRDAYTKLQKECGDEANKLNLERTPTEKIMRQYGDLALELGELPRSSDWAHQELKPTLSGLEKVHFIKWFEFPKKFMEWIETEHVNGYEKVLDWI